MPELEKHTLIPHIEFNNKKCERNKKHMLEINSHLSASRVIKAYGSDWNTIIYWLARLALCHLNKSLLYRSTIQINATKILVTQCNKKKIIFSDSPETD